MFCDLVGSTALSARLDPEDMRGIIAAYHRCCAESIERNGGFVAKYMGDGVLAYFGYPRAHEDDAEHAVQAGLATVDEAPRLKNALGETLHVRVGIATGIVVVGDLVGSGESSERGVVGDTPNLAARLQGMAEPDSVVIAETTRRLIAGLFELQDLGAHELKGFARVTKAFRALRPRSVESRFEAMHGGALTPLVGREKEVEILLRLWRRAKAGDGQVVVLTGEAGIGKSRITRELRDSLATEPHSRIRYQCSPYHTNSALYPVIQQISVAAGFFDHDDAEQRLDKLEALLGEAVCSTSEVAPLFAALLSLPCGRYSPLDLSPQQLRSRTVQALWTSYLRLRGVNPFCS
jgi:class 3 adenylate cyclase